MSVWRWVSDKSRVRQLPSWREFCARVERACILFWRQNCEAARDWQGERVIRQVDWAILDQEMNDQWALQFASIYVSVLRWNMGSKCEKSQFHLWGSSEPPPPRVGFQNRRTSLGKNTYYLVYVCQTRIYFANQYMKDHTFTLRRKIIIQLWNFEPMTSAIPERTVLYQLSHQANWELVTL